MLARGVVDSRAWRGSFEQQLALIEQTAALDPPPRLMGGWAEDAVLAGEATRPHEDLDWIVPRQAPLRLAQAAQLGFES